MGTIQDAIRQANLLEHELREAAVYSKPVTIYELFAKPDIQAVTTNPQQIRDKLTGLVKKEMVLVSKVRDPESHNLMNAYQWNLEYDGHIEVKRSQLKANDAKPSKPKLTKFDTEGDMLIDQQQQESIKTPKASKTVKAKGVELVLGQVSVVILSGAIQLDVNPVTNRSRITIEE